MRKPDLAAAIAEKADLTKEQANRVLNAVLEEITGALHRKDSVTLVGFGTFLQRHRGARTGKNPQTGEPVKIKASNTVAFKPGKSLKDSVNLNWSSNLGHRLRFTPPTFPSRPATGSRCSCEAC
ncbi:DNA-binding protein HU, alpha subunit [Pseudomonas fluorescens A506]|nr:DNA-binding protein HU, alpha subunit [Pseudomonas fluorescens A506]